jgi:hypothetical protein
MTTKHVTLQGRRFQVRGNLLIIRVASQAHHAVEQLVLDELPDSVPGDLELLSIDSIRRKATRFAFRLCATLRVADGGMC